MSKAPIMPFYTDAYLADCHHLSTEAHGALMLLLLHTWRLGGKPLPDDDKAIMRVVKVRSPKRWQKIRAELAPLFDLSDGRWRQSKLERTWAEVTQKIEQNRDNAKRRYTGKGSSKSLNERESVSATARDRHPPSMNHQPDPNNKPDNEPDPTNNINSLDNKEEVMMSLQTINRCALEALEPVLSDARYFHPRRDHVVSAKLAPQIAAATTEVEALLAPVKSERAVQIISRLMLHFPCTEGQKESRVRSDYAMMLSECPEDLLCAAYQHILKHHKYNTLPKIADFQAFIEPELNYRRALKRKLSILQSQLETQPNPQEETV